MDLRREGGTPFCLTISDYYDQNGNITSLETLVDVTWNYRDNIASAVLLQRTNNIDNAEYYVYDASGQRRRKVRETLISATWGTYEVEEKIYLGPVEIKRIRTVYGGTSVYTLRRSTLHVMDDTRRIATVHYWSLDTNLREIDSSLNLNVNKSRYQYGNHLDSASLELNYLGAIISYEEYFPYGDTSLMAGTAQKEVKLKEYRYTGKEKDDATGLYYFGARYYASWLGRWLSADPLFRMNPVLNNIFPFKDDKTENKYWIKVYKEGLNLYCYANANPIRFSDADGFQNVDSTVQNIKRQGIYLPKDTFIPSKGAIAEISGDYLAGYKYTWESNGEKHSSYQWRGEAPAKGTTFYLDKKIENINQLPDDILKIIGKNTQNTDSFTVVNDPDNLITTDNNTTTNTNQAQRPVRAQRPIRAEGARVSSWYIRRNGRLHAGLDIAGIPRGTNIYAMYSGIVVFSGWQNGYGWCVQIRNTEGPYEGQITTYAHMNERPRVRNNQEVDTNTILGFVGSSGGDYPVHFHIDIAPVAPSTREQRQNLDTIFHQLYP